MATPQTAKPEAGDGKKRRSRKALTPLQEAAKAEREIRRLGAAFEKYSKLAGEAKQGREKILSGLSPEARAHLGGAESNGAAQ